MKYFIIKKQGDKLGIKYFMIKKHRNELESILGNSKRKMFCNINKIFHP